MADSTTTLDRVLVAVPRKVIALIKGHPPEPLEPCPVMPAPKPRPQTSAVAEEIDSAA